MNKEFSLLKDINQKDSIKQDKDEKWVEEKKKKKDKNPHSSKTLLLNL